MIYVFMTFFMMLFAGIASIFDVRSFEDSKKRMAFHVNKKMLTFNFFMCISFLFPFFVAGLRYDVGTDYMGYLEKYIPHVMYGQYSYITLEPLFEILIKFSNLLGSYQWLFVFTHFLILYFVYKHIKKVSPNVVLSVSLIVLTGFFNTSLNIMRQSIAIAIFLYAITFIHERKLLKYAIAITIASLFHTSALIFFILYFLGVEKFSIKRKLIYTIGFLMLRALLDPIRIILISITQKFNFYNSYFGSVYDDTGNNYMYLLLNLFVCFFAIFIEKAYKFNDDNEKQLFNLFFSIQFIALGLSVVAPIIPNANRVIMMFSSIQITYIPLLLSKIKSGKLRLLFIILFMLIYLGIFYKMYYYGNSGETFPYKSIFSK